jgi:hypothetical protein
MGKNAKEHRKRVEARNRRIETTRNNFRKKFQEELLKQIEHQKTLQNEEGTVVSEIKRVNPEIENDAE